MTGVVAVDSPETLEQVLGMLLQPDSRILASAEASLAPFMRSKQCVPAFLQQMTDSQNPGIRQMGAVLLRSRISRFWSKLSVEDRNQTKQVLLHLLVHEPLTVVRLSVANLIADLAKYTVPAHQWPELFPFMFQCFSSSDSVHRDIAIRLFEFMLSTIGPSLKGFMGPIMQVLSSALADAEAAVRAAAIRCLNALLDNIEGTEHVAALIAMIPVMLNAMVYCVQTRQNEPIFEGLDVMIQVTNTNLDDLVPFIPQYVEFVISVASAQQVEVSTREKALDYIVLLANMRPKLLYQKFQLLNTILGGMFSVMAEKMDLDVTDESEDGAQKLGSNSLKELSLHIPSKHLWPVAEAMCGQGFQSADAGSRRAALVAIAILSETCNDQVRDNLAQLVRGAVHLLAGDPDITVRDAACFTIAQFSEHLYPEILEFHGDVIPPLLRLLSAPSTHPIVQESVCLVLDSYCEYFGERIDPYLRAMMETFSSVMQHGKLMGQAAAIGAIAAVALAARHLFVPYAHSTMDFLEHLMGIHDPLRIVLRARATEALGNIAVAIGNEHFAPRLDRVIQRAVEGFSIQNPELNEYTYGLFCSLAEVMPLALVPLLPKIVPLACSSCFSDAGILASEVERTQLFGAQPRVNVGDGEVGEGEDENDEEDIDFGEEDEENDIHLKIPYSILDEKAAAVAVLAKLARFTGTAFAPFLHDASDAVLSLSKFLHEHVRMNIPEAIFGFVKVLSESGLPATDETSRIFEVSMSTMLHYLEADESRTVCLKSCEYLQEIAKVTGPTPLGPFLEDFVSAWQLLLQKKAVCQTLCYDEADGDDDDEDTNRNLTDAVGDSIIAFAQVFGESFKPAVDVLEPFLMKYADKRRSEDDRIMATGVLAECARFLGAHCPLYAGKWFSQAWAWTNSDSVSVQRNAIFMLGVLAVNGGPSTQAKFSELMQLFLSISKLDAPAEIKDNAAGAIARIVQKFGSTLPLGPVVQLLVDFLPIRVDMIEAANVVTIVKSLVSEPVLHPHLNKIVSGFLETTALPDATRELRIATMECLQVIRERFGDATLQQALVSSKDAPRLYDQLRNNLA
eukprot:ANDGO_08626.mRNA.1 putative importin subunit beta-4